MLATQLNMTDYIIQIILFISFGIIVYVSASALPRISEETEEVNPTKNLLSSIPAQKIDLAIASFLEKTLRRSRLSLLRFDNVLNSYIGKIKAHATTSVGVSNQKKLFPLQEENEVSKSNEIKDSL